MIRLGFPKVPDLVQYTTPVAEKTYLFRVPYYGFYIWFLRKVGLFGYRQAFF